MSKLGKILEPVFTKLGNNNKAIYPVMLIATVKGICRPTFTMMDKTEDPQTKKYTAIREGLTEVIAIPTYFMCGKVSESLSKVFPEKLKRNAATNLMFIGVCTAALFVIPALCSITIKPLMDSLQKRIAKKNPAEPLMLQNTVNPTKFPVKYHSNFTSLNTFSNRMPDAYRLSTRIGGV